MNPRYFLAPLAALALLAAPRLALAQTTPGGGVGIGTTAPDASAALDIVSSSKGLLLPRLTQAQRDAIYFPATGLTIFNTTTNKLNTWNGTNWDSSLSDTKQPVPNPAVTFGYTGGPQTYTVPAGVTSLLVDASGARGGGSEGGPGGRVRTTLAVTPGETLTLYVGGTGGRVGLSYNGGGFSTQRYADGGGATDVRRSATVPSTNLADRLVVAGGGGGGDSGGRGGAGGGLTGGNGAGWVGGQGGGGQGGGGGTQTAGGIGPTGASSSSLGMGGSAPPKVPYQERGEGGGGGGGYYGGGAASGFDAAGGGSGYVAASGTSNTTMVTGGASGANGSLTLTPSPGFSLVPPAPTLNGTNITNVPGTWSVNGSSYYYNNGNVGIGTNSPSQKLEVMGNVKITGSGNGITFNDGTTQTTASSLTNLTGDVTSSGSTTTYNNVVPAAKGGAGTISGLLKADGSGTVSAAVAGTDYLTPAAASTGFIQNTTTQQASSSFNVSGTGTVGGQLTAGSAAVSGNLGLGTTAADPITQKLDVRGNVRLGDNANGGTGAGQAIEWVGPGVNTDPVGLYRYNPASDASELRVVVGDVADANDKFSVGRMNGVSNEGGIPAGTFTPTFTVRADGNVGVGTGTPTSTLQVVGSVAASIRTLNSGTIAATDYTVIVGGNVSLPAPDATNAGRLYHLLYNSTGVFAYIVTGTFRDPGNEFTTNSFQLSAATNSKGITVQSDGTQWWILTRE